MTNIGSRAGLLAVPLIALAAACAHDSSWRMNARVLSRAPDSRDASGLRPVADAAVAVECPQSGTREIGRTDSGGELRMDEAGSLPLTCNLIVSQQGYRPAKFAVADTCAERSGSSCRTVDLRTVLSAAANGKVSADVAKTQ
jgi:hypothetical protein